MYVRRRPTLPRPRGRSTIGAERLNFRVRDGTGCFPFAMAAVTLATHHIPDLPMCVGWGVVVKLVCLCVDANMCAGVLSQSVDTVFVCLVE